MRVIDRVACAALLAIAGSPLLAQEAAVGPAAAPPVQQAGVAPAEVTIPALTPVKVEVLEDVSSGLNKSGDTFRLKLAEPVVVNRVEVIPAGTPGVGEVIHAKKSGGSGSGGELILAADYLELDGRRLPLRSLSLSGTGKDNIGTVNAINVGSAATVPGVALIGFLIKGKQMTVPKGTRASAKTSADFAVAKVPPPLVAANAADGLSAQISTGGNAQ